jgi:hypothetical protein
MKDLEKINPDQWALYVRSVLDYDPDTGVMRWKFNPSRVGTRAAGWNTKYAGQITGYKGLDGYLRVHIGRKPELLHRLAWLWMTGKWPTAQLDHINCVRDDNRFANLREATAEENTRNCGPRARNKSGIKGVSPSGSRWKAQIKSGSAQLNLGRFNTKEEAARAYAAAAGRLHGEFARTK